jgi:hypothetical protein
MMLRRPDIRTESLRSAASVFLSLMNRAGFELVELTVGLGTRGVGAVHLPQVIMDSWTWRSEPGHSSIADIDESVAAIAL